MVRPLTLPLGRGEAVRINREPHLVAFWSVAGPFLAPYPHTAWPLVLERQAAAGIWWTNLLQTTVARVTGLSEPRCTLDLSELKFPPRYADRFGQSMSRYLFHVCKAFYRHHPEARDRLTSRVSGVVQNGYLLGPPRNWQQVPLTESALKQEAKPKPQPSQADDGDVDLAAAFAVRPLPGCARPDLCPCARALDQGAVRLALAKSFAGDRQATSLAVRAVLAAVEQGGAHVTEEALTESVPGLRGTRVVYSLCQREHRYCFPWLAESAMTRNSDGTLQVHPLLRSHLSGVDRCGARFGFEDATVLSLPLPDPEPASVLETKINTDGVLLSGTACLECRAARRNRSQCLSLGHALQAGCANESLVSFAPCPCCRKKRRTLAGCLAAGHLPGAERQGQKQKGGRRRPAVTETDGSKPSKRARQ